MTESTTSPSSKLESTQLESNQSAEIEQPTDVSDVETAEATEPAPSYVKLAMRNMVRKGGKSLFHFFLTTTGLIGLFIGLAYLTR